MMLRALLWLSALVYLTKGLPTSVVDDTQVKHAAAHRETVEEAAAWTRQILDNRADGMATLASIFPEDFPVADLRGRPAAFLEYFAPAANGSLYMLLMPISQTVHNIFIDQQKHATVTIKDEEGERRSHKGEGATNRGRVTMWGNVVVLPDQSGKEAKVAKSQYIKYHPDSKVYLPPNQPHQAYWCRFDPTTIYYFGGFGDVHYLGYLPMDLYRSTFNKHEALEDVPSSTSGQLPLAVDKLLQDW